MDELMRVNNREKMMLSVTPRMPPDPKHFMSAFTPFPRSTWIHPHVPSDSFDGVCKIIWKRAEEAKEELGRGQSSPERQRNEEHKPTDRAEQQQGMVDDLGLSTQYEEDKLQTHTAFILPCPYLSGHRHPHDAQPAQEEDASDKQRNVEHFSNKTQVPQTSSRRDKQSSAPQCQPPRILLSRDTCESEDEENLSGSCYMCSSDDEDFVSLPGVRSCATGSSDVDSESEDNDKKDGNKKDTPSSSHEQDSPSSVLEDFPPLCTRKAGIAPCPTEPPASGKMHSQWETPLSFHPHDIPTVALARGVTAHAQAPFQGKAEAPQANWKNKAPPEAPTQQEAYDLLADFPALQPPEKPSVLDALRKGNPKFKGAEGKRWLTHSKNQRQESGASHQRRMENMPHEVSSICARDQTFGSDQSFSPSISCEEPNANNLLPPPVAGTDGMDVNARTWASAAKAGMKQAAAPQERARPCTFQQIVTINRAKVGYSGTHNFPNRGALCYRAAAPRPRNPNRFIRPGFPPTHKHFGAQAYRANCPPGFRHPRLPFQQARGYPSKHSHR